MHRGIIVAICVSILLIGGASWSRFSGTETSPGLIAVGGEKDTEKYYQEVLAGYLDTASTTSIESEPLTSTDLVGRQLIMDYLALAQTGEVSQESLDTLMERYVESIPTINSSTKLSLLDLEVVPNDHLNLEKYASAIQKVHRNYASALISTYSSKGDSIQMGDSELYYAVSEIYRETAEKLLAMSVPAQLAQVHLELANLYQENASAMRALGVAEFDPASSFAGLIAIKNNAEREQNLLSEIEDILDDNGI